MKHQLIHHVGKVARPNDNTLIRCEAFWLGAYPGASQYTMYAKAQAGGVRLKISGHALFNNANQFPTAT